MEVNINKTKIVHFRKNSERTKFNFHLGNRHIDVCETYKYLGIILNEYLDYTETANALSESAGRAFSSLIVNLYNKMDLLFSSYTKVYESKLVPIMDYSSSVWGTKCFPKQTLYITESSVFILESTNIRQISLSREIWVGHHRLYASN